jgi:O-antigen ligase
MVEQTGGKYIPERSVWVMLAVVAFAVGAVVSLSLYGGIALGVFALLVLAFPFYLTNSRYVFYVFVFTLPFGETDILGGDTPIAVTLSNMQLMLLVVLLTERFLRRVVENGGKLGIAKPYKLYVAALSLIVAADLISIALHPVGARFLITRISLVLTFLVGIVFIDSPRTMRVTLRCLAISLMIASILTILHSLGYTDFGHTKVQTPTRIGEWRPPFPRTIGIPGIDFGLYGMFMLSAFPLMLISLLKKKPLFHSRLFSMIWIALVVLGVFISQSRSTWLGFVASLFVVMFLLCPGERGIAGNSSIYLSALLVVGLILLFTLGWLLLQEGLLELGASLLSSLSKMRSTGVTERLAQIEFAWKIMTQNVPDFLFGQGYLVFEDLYASAYPDASTYFLHNHYMGYFFGSGALGLLSYGFLLLAALRAFCVAARRGRRSEHLWGVGLLAGFVGMLVVLAFFAKISNVKLLWLMIALAQRIAYFSVAIKEH